MAYQKLQAGRAAAVTPSNTVDIPSVTGGSNNGCTLYVGGTGSVKVLTIGGDEVTFSADPGGTYMSKQVLRVFPTRTS